MNQELLNDIVAFCADELHKTNESNTKVTLSNGNVYNKKEFNQYRAVFHKAFYMNKLQFKNDLMNKGFEVDNLQTELDSTKKLFDKLNNAPRAVEQFESPSQALRYVVFENTSDTDDKPLFIWQFAHGHTSHGDMERPFYKNDDYSSHYIPRFGGFYNYVSANASPSGKSTLHLFGESSSFGIASKELFDSAISFIDTKATIDTSAMLPIWLEKATRGLDHYKAQSHNLQKDIDSINQERKTEKAKYSELYEQVYPSTEIDDQEEQWHQEQVLAEQHDAELEHQANIENCDYESANNPYLGDIEALMELKALNSAKKAIEDYPHTPTIDKGWIELLVTTYNKNIDSAGYRQNHKIRFGDLQPWLTMEESKALILDFDKRYEERKSGKLDNLPF